jgi:hypothetical protein
MTNASDLPKTRAMTYVVLAGIASGLLYAGYISAPVWAGVFEVIAKGVGA